MHLDRIQIHQLRVFLEVYRTRSMTDAAKALHLTQSGVSQHIKSLEESLENKLFDRFKLKLIPTADADRLYEASQAGFQLIESGLEMILGRSKEVHGKVRLGLPVEFGNNVIMPMIGKFQKDFPGVTFQIVLDFASKLNGLLLNGDLDLAMVDDYAMDRAIETKVIFREQLELCISKNVLKAFPNPIHSKKYFQELPFIAYQEGAPILRWWFRHHLKGQDFPLNVRVTVMDVWGVSRLILADVGAGVLPKHFVDRLGPEGTRLFLFPGSGKPLFNSIRMAYLREKSMSEAVQVALDFFLKSFPNVKTGDSLE